MWCTYWCLKRFLFLNISMNLDRFFQLLTNTKLHCKSFYLTLLGTLQKLWIKSIQNIKQLFMVIFPPRIFWLIHQILMFILLILDLKLWKNLQSSFWNIKTPVIGLLQKYGIILRWVNQPYQLLLIYTGKYKSPSFHI